MRIAAARAVAFLITALICLCLPYASAAQQPRKLSSRDVARMLAEADKLAAEGQVGDARQHLTAIVQHDPTNAAAAFKLGRLCETMEDWDCVLTAYQLSVANLQGQEKAEAHAGLAAGHLRANRYTDAAEHARAAITLNPSFGGAHVILATSLVRLKSPDALDAAQAATDAAPESALAHAALGEALVAAGRGPEAEAPLRKAIELDPGTAGAHAALAEILDRKGDPEGVIASATRALEIDASLRHLFALRGQAYLARGQEEEALADLHAAAAVNPRDASLHMALAGIHRKHQRMDVAAKHYRSAAGIDPQLGEAFLGLSDILAESRDFQSAREPIERAAALLPQSARAHYLVGLLREEERQFDAAFEAFDRAIALDPELAGAHHRRGRVLREHRKDPAGGLASLEKAAALEAENPAILTDLGAALYDTKEVDRTIETLRKAVASPGYQNAMGFGVLGLALKDKHDFAEALGYFEQAAELAPQWWLPHWGAAWSHFGLIKKGCPCDAADQERVQKMKAHFEQMRSLEGKDPMLAERVEALVGGQKIR
jgi:tetratricopeptide (TPR) repeat protein